MRCSAQLLTGAGSFKEMKDKGLKGPCDETPIPISELLYGFNVFSQDDWSSQQSPKRCEENIIVWTNFFRYSISVSIPCLIWDTSTRRDVVECVPRARKVGGELVSFSRTTTTKPAARTYRWCLAQMRAFESWTPNAQTLSTQRKSSRIFPNRSVHVHRSARHTRTRPRTLPTRWWKPPISQPYSDIQIDDRIDLIFVYLN